jgi:hypothetical protein
MSDRITPDSFFSDTHAFHGVGGTTTVRLSSLVFSFRLLKFFRSAKNRERSEGKRKNNFHFGPSVVTQLFGELFFLFFFQLYSANNDNERERRRFAPRVGEFCFDMHVLLTKVSFCLFSTTTVATTADVYEPAGADGSRRERRRRRKRFRR